jgi:hypothetical protein
LGDLTEAHRAAITAALDHKGAANEAIAMIELRFATDPQCGHCGSANFSSWGRISDLRRYKCKDGLCTFNALTGTPLAQLHRRDFMVTMCGSIRREPWLIVPACEMPPSAPTCALRPRFAGGIAFCRRVNPSDHRCWPVLSRLTKRFSSNQRRAPQSLGGAHKRGGKAEKPGLPTEEHDAILIVRDRNSTTTDHILCDLEGATFAMHLKLIVSQDGVLVSDGRAAYGAFAKADTILHIPIVASLGEYIYEGFHI